MRSQIKRSSKKRKTDKNVLFSIEKKEAQTPSKKNLLNERYDISSEKVLGRGSFGEILLAYDTLMRKWVAIKIINCTSIEQQQTVKHEISVLEAMKGEEGFPEILDNGVYQESIFIVQEMLGPTLTELLDYCNRAFSIKTVCLIAIQVLTRMAALHSKHFIHRDIKPENFLIGCNENSNTIYAIDFGLCKTFKTPDGNHIPYRENKNLVGTARYASLNNHLGIEQSRRDDLEAIGYMIINLAIGNLPWQGVKHTEKSTKYKLIMQKKMNTVPDVLCRKLPSFKLKRGVCQIYELR